MQVGAIHGRLLTAWSAAGVAWPLIVNAITDRRASAGIDGASPYRPSLLIMVGVLIVGFGANLVVRPVNSRFHEPAGPDGTSRGPSDIGHDIDLRAGRTSADAHTGGTR